MTRLQMIVTWSGHVLNFDQIAEMRIECENPNHTAGYTYRIEAVGNNGNEYDICGNNGYDYETAKWILMSEIARAKQTDGIARFDGDSMARLHEKGV